MKLRRTNPRFLCYMSAIALAVAGCSQNTTKVKPTPPPTADNQTDSLPSSGAQSRLFHYSKKGVRQVKITDTRRTKRVQYEYANLWERLFDSYLLPDVRNDAVERELAWFVNHPTYLQRAQQRAEPFLYNIVQQIERQGVPGELALLPVVESAFQAQAVSPAKAAGIWQFIPATGRNYGLRQNHSYDGRRDVYASTKAAIKYLKKLNRQFDGDWLLSIAAYNCGEGAVAKAIQRNIYRNLPTDFWSLDLPQETRSYVPRLLAVSRLFSDADRFGVDLRYIPNEAVFKPVKISQQLDLALAADAADMSLDEFRALNPGFKNMFADPEGSVRLFVPANKSKTFKKELARLANVQTDLLRKEFDRPGGVGNDDFTGLSAASASPEPYSYRKSEPRIESASTPPPAESLSGYRPTPARSANLSGEPDVSTTRAVAKAFEPAAYGEVADSANPFQPAMQAVEEPSNDPSAIEQPSYRQARKSRHGSIRTHAAPASDRNRYKPEPKKAAAPSRSHNGASHAPRAPVAYKYSAAAERKPAAKSQAAPVAQYAGKSAPTVHKTSKVTVASAPRAGQPVKYKNKESAAAAAPQHSASKTTESRKTTYHVASAKADPPRGKTKH